MKFITGSTFLLVVLLFLITADSVYAGFGVTPPYFRNTSLTRNSIYEQQILLVRGDPKVPLKATVMLDAPEIEDWIEIVEGNEFVLPRGEQKVPMTVRVKVPGDVDFKEYTGAIRVKTGPVDDQVAAGAVSISLGAQIQIKLNVIDREIKDFRVRRINLPDLNEGYKLGWLYFPGKIRFGMLLENTGNVDVSPSEVTFNIYDVTGNVLLEETSNIGRIEKLVPYETSEVFAELPTRLPPGSYIAKFRVYNGDEIKHEGESTMNIVPYGTLQTAGFGFTGLSVPHKLSVILPILAVLALIIFVIHSVRTNRRRE